MKVDNAKNMQDEKLSNIVFFFFFFITLFNSIKDNLQNATKTHSSDIYTTSYSID